MVNNALGIVLMLSFGVIAAHGGQRAVDCRKFVFAPICRGVSKKNFDDPSNNPEPPLHIKSPSFPEYGSNSSPNVASRRLSIQENENIIRSLINKLEEDDSSEEDMAPFPWQYFSYYPFQNPYQIPYQIPFPFQFFPLRRRIEGGRTRPYKFSELVN